MQKLINTKPSNEWMEGYPIGNGRLGVVLWDENNADILSLNHEWLWRGVYRNQKCKSAAHNLEEVRSIFKTKGCGEGTNKAVELLASPEYVVKVDSYQPAGDIYFKVSGENKLLSRELDIEEGIATVKRQNVTGEFYTDIVKDLIIAKWFSENKFDAELCFTRVEDADADVKYNMSENTLEFYCSIKNGCSFGVKIWIYTDGIITVSDNELSVEGATYVYTKSDIGTEIYGIEKELTEKQYDFENDKKLHTDKFSEFMSKVSFNVTDDDKFSPLTVEERIDRIRGGEKDNGFAKLYFDYARYLMISCSVFATLPANLQGKWNREIFPPWYCDYHFDINLQMNYWMCEALNMSDFCEPLVDYLVRIGEKSREGANLRYGCRGIVMPLSDSAWAEGLPMSKEYGIWTGSAAWMAQHLWWHYTYTNDIEYLKEKAYPFFKGTAEFYEDFLEADKNGELQFIPSQSPENKFIGGGDYDIALSISSSSDVQLCYDALNYAIKTANILGVDADKVEIWKNILNHLPEFKIGIDGRLLEWNEEKEEEQPGHKHLSHLYGLYPGDIFFDEKYKKQFDAAVKSFDYRIENGGGYTGWSSAWISCMYARLGRGDSFYDQLCHLTTDYVTTSVLDIHPPRIFQIDGNFGAAAAIIEAIVSCVKGKVYLCRAIPGEWKEGSLCGIKVPGGHKVNVWWENNKISKAEIEIGFKEELTLNANGTEIKVSGKSGEVKELLF